MRQKSNHITATQRRKCKRRDADSWRYVDETVDDGVTLAEPSKYILMRRAESSKLSVQLKFQGFSITYPAYSRLCRSCESNNTEVFLECMYVSVAGYVFQGDLSSSCYAPEIDVCA